MKKVKNVEVEKYHLTDNASILLEHNQDSDSYFATVVCPDDDFSAPLYSFNDASAFLLHYNPKNRFHSFEEAIQYIESTKSVQDELKSIVPDYSRDKEDEFTGFDEDEDFPFGGIIEFKAKLLTDKWTQDEMNAMLRQAKKNALAMTDDIVADKFIKGEKTIDHSAKTEYYRLMFLYTTFNDDFDEYAESDVDNVLSLMFAKKIRIRESKNKAIIYKRIKELLTVYDDVFSEKNASPKMTYWLQKSIVRVLKLYHLV